MNHSMNVNPFSIGFDSLQWLSIDNLFARKAQLWDNLIRESIIQAIIDGARYLERVVTRRNVKKVFREIYCKMIK